MLQVVLSSAFNESVMVRSAGIDSGNNVAAIDAADSASSARDSVSGVSGGEGTVLYSFIRRRSQVTNQCCLSYDLCFCEHFVKLLCCVLVSGKITFLRTYNRETFGKWRNC